MHRRKRPELAIGFRFTFRVATYKFRVLRSAPPGGPIWAIFGLLQVPDFAIIQVIWSPHCLVPDKDSRFGEGGINGDQDTLIDKTRCTADGFAPTTLTSK